MNTNATDQVFVNVAIGPKVPMYESARLIARFEEYSIVTFDGITDSYVHTSRIRTGNVQ